MATVKPILYIDVDGVLFGYYGHPECLQLRPGVLSFLTWAQEHFVCRWLTAWPEAALRGLFGHMYGEQVAFPEWVDWHEMSRDRGVTDRKTAAFDWQAPWFWIEDGLAAEEKAELTARGCTDHYIYVNPKGADDLLRIRGILEARLASLEQNNKAPIEAVVEGD